MLVVLVFRKDQVMLLSCEVQERECLPPKERAVPLPTSTCKIGENKNVLRIQSKTSSCYTFNIHQMLSWEFSRNPVFGQERRVLSSSELQRASLTSTANHSLDSDLSTV